MLGDAGVFSIKDADALKGYDSIYIKSVTANPSAGARNLDPSEIAALEYALQGAIKSHIGGALPIVESPSVNSLSLVATINEVEGLSPLNGATITANNLADNANHYGAGAAAGIGTFDSQISGSTLRVSRIQVKIELLGSNGEMLAVFSDSNFGSDIEYSASGITNWSRVSDAFNRWCNELGSQLANATAK
ncbi:hypothetical protein GCM10007047_30540 [Cerasicoccus arenae]|uniref:Uncharacterized protein n=2 Tax=Cerasicoccus arenae TaxID=424488 RepID=A0A8J3DME1_9BACT|nr:hypothetical protein GCM10007047_30540 [Cerasicoccus arenae]